MKITGVVCDLCGKYCNKTYKSVETSVLTVKKDHTNYIDNRRLDLCKDCACKLYNKIALFRSYESKKIQWNEDVNKEINVID